MADIIEFPLVRRSAHVALVWDNAWDQFRIETHGRHAAGLALSWRADYAKALHHAAAVAVHFGLPLVDLTGEGGAA